MDLPCRNPHLGRESDREIVYERWRQRLLKSCDVSLSDLDGIYEAILKVLPPLLRDLVLG